MSVGLAGGSFIADKDNQEDLEQVSLRIHRLSNASEVVKRRSEATSDL